MADVVAEPLGCENRVGRASLRARAAFAGSIQSLPPLEPVEPGDPDDLDPHDALFRAAFSLPARAGGLLRHILPAGMADAIRWDSLQSEEAIFVDRELDRHATDVLFRAEIAGYPRDECMHLLLEHQSRVEACR